MATNKEVDHVSGTETTGHEWDGIKELNTPLPRWWLVIFYACIVYAIGYWVLMPAWPTWNGYTHGLLGASERADVADESHKLQVQRTAEAADLDKTSLAQIVARPKLLEFALAEGKSVFGDNCAPCHGSGAQGSRATPISMTTIGCGVARSPISSTRSPSAYVRPARIRASRRCRPSAAMGCSNRHRSMT